MDAQEYQLYQDQINNDPNSIYADTIREEKITNIVGQINPEKLVIDIENRIRGYRKDPFTQRWKEISKKKIVSEELIADIVSYLGAFLNDNTTFSNYSTIEINNLMEKVIDYLTDSLSDNDLKYGFKKEIVKTEKIKVKEIIRIEGQLPIYREIIIEKEKVIEENTDYHEMTRVFDIICQEIFAVYKRALNGQESNRIFKALKVTESNNPNQNKKSFSEAIQFWK